MAADEPAIPSIRSLHGTWLRLHPRFIGVNFELDSCVMQLFETHLRPGSIVLDIGANVGFYALWMAKRVGRSGRVFAFEPSPPNLKILRYHLAKNGLRNLQVLPCAVTEDHGGHVPFFLLNEGDSPSNSLTFGRNKVPNLSLNLAQTKREILVDRISVDGFCKDSQIRPALIKIDVEGAELLVLRGASATLVSARPALILGVHPWWLPEGQSTDDILAFLRKHDYVTRNSHGAIVSSLEYADYLCLPAERA